MANELERNLERMNISSLIDSNKQLNKANVKLEEAVFESHNFLYQFSAREEQLLKEIERYKENFLSFESLKREDVQKAEIILDLQVQNEMLKNEVTLKSKLVEDLRIQLSSRNPQRFEFHRTDIPETNISTIDSQRRMEQYEELFERMKSNESEYQRKNFDLLRQIEDLQSKLRASSNHLEQVRNEANTTKHSKVILQESYDHLDAATKLLTAENRRISVEYSRKLLELQESLENKKTELINYKMVLLTNDSRIFLNC